jgi:hypothetical protein
MILKIVIGFVLIYAMWALNRAWTIYKTWLKLKKEGVQFNGGFSLIKDPLRIMGSFADSSEYQVFNIMRQICDGVMPPIFGWVFPDKIVLYVNSVEFLEDIYTKQTPYMTKHWSD